MIILVKSNPQYQNNQRYHLLLIAKLGEKQIIIQKNLKEIFDFLQTLENQLQKNHIRFNKVITLLSNQQLGDILTIIFNHPHLNDLIKVKRFFIILIVQLNKVKIDVSKTISIKPSKTKKFMISPEKKQNPNAASTIKKQETLQTKIVHIANTKQNIKKDLHINNTEVINYIENLGYTQVIGIANGTTKAVFKAKNSRGQIVAVKIGKLEGQEKMKIQKGIANSVGQKMSRALFGGFLDIYKIIQDVQKNLIIIQQELANKTLRDIIVQKRLKNQNFTFEELKKITQDLVESLYHMHIQNQVAHRDIKPENIFYMEHRYSFGDYGEAQQKNVNILDRKLKIKMNELKGTPMYMETKLLEMCSSTKLEDQLSKSKILVQTQNFAKIIEYDPFKADIYSLGLVFFELSLHNYGFRLDSQIQTLFYWQRNDKIFYQLLNIFDLRNKQQKYILFDKKLYEIPSILTRMLDQNESTRINTFQLSLLVANKQTIISNILTPFTDIFIPNKTIIEKNIYKIEYNYKLMIYKGQCTNMTREGQGKMFRRTQNQLFTNGVILEQDSEFEQDSQYYLQANLLPKNSKQQQQGKLQILYSGFWKDDLPSGKGTLILNDSQNKYEGNFLNGMFFNEGSVFFKDKLMFKCRWKANINQNMLIKPNKLVAGIYRFKVKPELQNLVYGYFEQSEQKVNQIILEINNEQIIKQLMHEIINWLMQTEIEILDLKYNLIYEYTKLILFNQEDKIEIFFRGSQIVATEIIAKVIQNMKVTKLKSINLQNTFIRCPIIVNIAQNLNIYNLTELNLSNCYYIFQNSLNNFFSTSSVNSILKLNMCSTQISDNTLKIFAESQYLIRLRQLNIRKCRLITKKGFLYWITSKNVGQLQLLDIGYLNISNSISEGFSKQKHLKKLRRLKIDNISISQQSLAVICKDNNIVNLIQLECSALWIKQLHQFKKLRTIVLTGKQKIKRIQLYQFLQNYKYSKLQVKATKCFQYVQDYQTTKQQFRKVVTQRYHKSLILQCKQNDINFEIDILSNVINKVILTKELNMESISEFISLIKFNNWTIKEINIRYNLNTLEFLEKLFKLDLKVFHASNLCIQCDSNYELQNMQPIIQYHKINFLNLSQKLDKILFAFNPDHLKIIDIFQTDLAISRSIRTKLNTVKIIEINKFIYLNQNVFDAQENLHLNEKYQTNAKLDQILHALSVSQCLIHLTRLNLRGRQNITEKGLSYIINSKFCQNIELLDLSNTQCSGNIFLLLIKSMQLKLKQLIVNNVKNLVFEDVVDFVFSQKSGDIKRLSMKNTNLNNVDLYFLSLNLENLQQIDMNFSEQLISQYENIDKLISNIKYSKIKKVYLDFSNCFSSSMMSIIFNVLLSQNLSKIKLNFTNLKQHQLDYHQVSKQLFIHKLNQSKVRYFTQFYIYFNKTEIFHDFFFEYLPTITTKTLRLSFSEKATNSDIQQLKACLNSQLQLIHIFEFNVEKCLIDDQVSDDICYIFSNLKVVEVLIINFSYCRQIKKWQKIIKSLVNLKQIKQLSINLQSCNLENETDILFGWIDKLTDKRKIKISINLSRCWKIKLENFSKMIKSVSDKNKFYPKIKIILVKISLPILLRNKLKELNKQDQYEFIYDDF